MDRLVQFKIDVEDRRRARRRAAEQGLTLSAYVVRLIEQDLEDWTPGAGPPIVQVPDTADAPEHDGMYIGEAVAARMSKPAEPEA